MGKVLSEHVIASNFPLWMKKEPLCDGLSLLYKNRGMLP